LAQVSSAAIGCWASRSPHKTAESATAAEI